MKLPQSKLHCRSFTVVAMLALAWAALPLSLRAGASELSISPSQLSYGQVAVRQTHQRTVTITNTGKEKVTISRVSASSKDFTVSGLKLPKVLSPREHLAVIVTFKPSAEGTVNGKLVFASSSDHTIELAVEGTGTDLNGSESELVANPASVAFGDVDVGQSSTVSITLTNTRKSKITVESPTITGSPFSLSGVRFPLVLISGQHVKIEATFKPTAAGTIDGDVVFSSPSLTVPLAGTGQGTTGKSELSLSPASLNFGNVTTGSTETLTLGLSASGSSVTVSSLASSNSQFEIIGASLPLTIAAGHETLINVAFRPQSSGKVSGTLTIASNATDAKESVPLAGTGASSALSVALSWNASTSEVRGYNVYRSKSATGSFTKLNSGVDTNTSYDDTTIVSGNTYYYATTAVSSNGVESAYSNSVEVVVP